MGCLNSFNVNLEMTAAAQGQKGTCLPFSLAMYPLSWHVVFGSPSSGEPYVKALLPTPHTKFSLLLIFAAPSLPTLCENVLLG